MYRARDKEKTLSLTANPFFLQKNLFKSLTASTCLYLPRRNSAAVKQIQVPQINKKAQLLLLNPPITMRLGKEKNHVTN